MKLFLMSKGEAEALKAKDRWYPHGWWLRTKSLYPGRGDFFAIRPTGSGYISEFDVASRLAVRPALNVKPKMMERLERNQEGDYLLGYRKIPGEDKKKIEWILAGTKNRLLMKEHLWTAPYSCCKDVEYEDSDVCSTLFSADNVMFSDEERRYLMDAPAGRIWSEKGDEFSLTKLRAFFKDIGLKGEPSEILAKLDEKELDELRTFAKISLNN